LDQIEIIAIKHILFIFLAFIVVSFTTFQHVVQTGYSQDPLFDPNDLPKGQPVQENPVNENQPVSENQSDDEFSTPDFGSDSSSGGDASLGSGSGGDASFGSGSGGDASFGSGSGGDASFGSGSTGQFNAFPNGTRLVVNMSNSTGDSINAQFAVYGNRIYAIWQEVTAGGNDVVQIRSVDSGISYEKLKHVSTDTGKSSNPSIAVSGNIVYVVWTQLTDAGTYDIFFARSLDGGGEYEKEKKLATASGEAPYPKLVVSGNATYVVWNQLTVDGTHEIFFTRSLDGGAGFNEPINISNNIGDSLNPQISAFNGSVNIVWGDDSNGNSEVLIAKSTTNGNSFEKAVNISNNPGESLNPQIFTSRGRTSVVWEDSTSGNGSNNDILFTRGNASTGGFDKPINVSNNPGQSLTPTVAASGANIYVAWRDSSQGNNEIFLSRSTNNGATFGNFTNLSNTTGDSTGQSLAASNTNVYIVWSDKSQGNGDIIYIKSNNYGATFEKTKNLSNNQEESVIPRISLIGDREYILWRDETVASRAEVKLTDKASSAVDFTAQTTSGQIGTGSEFGTGSDFGTGSEFGTGSDFGTEGQFPQNQSEDLFPQTQSEDQFPQTQSEDQFPQTQSEDQFPQTQSEDQFPQAQNAPGP
jgi:hypothetical protein